MVVLDRLFSQLGKQRSPVSKTFRVACQLRARLWDISHVELRILRHRAHLRAEIIPVDWRTTRN
ncbi:MAG: hypothetical protein A2Y77_15100 [Planctomycetes bacterium RBG_13_62_9]|nr:MAG: hypothetical protein A2Y77_15100 [Planctomycetes bacterium RBG_13_62_9]